MDDTTKKIQEQLDEAGFENAIAVATQAEINAGAACGQLTMVIEVADEQN